MNFSQEIRIVLVGGGSNAFFDGGRRNDRVRREIEFFVDLIWIYLGF